MLLRSTKNDSLNTKWCHNLSIAISFGKISTSRVCADHFDKLFLGKKKLLANAIPTINLGHNSIGDIHYPTVKINIKCAIKSCDGSQRSSRMFRFPGNIKLKNTWMEICGINKDANTSNLYLCSNHFDQKYLGIRKLFANAIPTINLVNASCGIPLNTNKSAIDSNLNEFEFNEFSDVSSVIIPKRSYEGPNSKNRVVYEDLTFEELDTLTFSPRKRHLSISSMACGDCVKKQQNVQYFKERTKFFSDKCLALSEENKLLKKEIKKYRDMPMNISDHIDSLNEVPENSKEFCKMLLSNKNTYSDQQKHICQNINYKSYSCYSFIREDLGFHLLS